MAEDPNDILLGRKPAQSDDPNDLLMGTPAEPDYQRTVSNALSTLNPMAGGLMRGIEEFSERSSRAIGGALAPMVGQSLSLIHI